MLLSLNFLNKFISIYLWAFLANMSSALPKFLLLASPGFLFSAMPGFLLLAAFLKQPFFLQFSFKVDGSVYNLMLKSLLLNVMGMWAFLLPLNVMKTLVSYSAPDFMKMLMSYLALDMVSALVSLSASDMVSMLVLLLMALAAPMLMPGVLSMISSFIMLMVKGSGATNMKVNKDDMWKLLKMLKKSP